MKHKHTFTHTMIVWVGMATCGWLTSANAADTRAVAEQAEPANDRLAGICAAEGYAFTPKVRKAFLAHAKQQAAAVLKAEGKSLPKDFLAWIDSDPEVQAAVYGAHNEPWDVLLWLYSLRLDLGKAKFEKYHQLALAAAIVSAKQDMEADVTSREPLKLVIHGDPRKLIDTKEPGRELDKNDHIINFLNDNTIEEEVVSGYKDAVPELKYDKQGIAIPAPKSKEKPKQVPVIEKRKRSLYACDVLADKALQAQFNAYMKSKGHPVDIDCGDRIVHWKSRDAVHGQQNRDITAAYKLFRAAYEAKGYLPAQRDPIPSPAERCIYIIRNYEHEFPTEIRANREWPQFPITAPWPVLTLLVDDDQPLREREERWIAFRDRGEFKKYGEYIGAIAQQFDIQSARRLKPHPFTYHTIQMMLKDGGVCGTMGAISARSHVSLGIPACQAIQPGHCAMVAFQYDAKKAIYICKGGQYATGGDEKTTPFARWYFGDDAKNYPRRPGFGVQPNPRKPMVYHQSIAWAVNHGMSAFLDSTIAYSVYRLLDEPARKGRATTLLASGLAMNPYNFLLADAAQAAADTPEKQLRFWQTFQAALQAAADKSGCPADGLYSETVKKNVFESIAKLPVPENKQTIKEIYAFLQTEKCDVPEALLIYRLAIEGLPALLTDMETQYKNHLISVRIKASPENDTACAIMAASLKTSAACIEDEEQRTQWALKLWKQAAGREKYFGRWLRVSTDPSVLFLAKQAGQRMPDDTQLMQSLLDLLTAELKDSVAGQRDIENCRVLADKIEAAAKHTKDPDQKRKWTRGLSKIITGHETFKPQTAKKDAEALRDPCADAVKGLLTAT
ncbi:MAG: hypothetical protein HQ567_31650 [Candidatus Nealsonbacteria bacterium]|nr:hypothetical protein [Candidatus Nealsonbacteria bacterium]